MSVPILDSPEKPEPEPWEVRWPFHKWPGLYLPPDKFFALKRRRRQRAHLRAEIHRLLPVELASELPDAVNYLLTRFMEGRNGKAEKHRR